jgi:hypothetical protein
MGNGITLPSYIQKAVEPPSLRRLYRTAQTARMDTKLALSMHPYKKPYPLPPSSQKEKGREGISGMSQESHFILR